MGSDCVNLCGFLHVGRTIGLCLTARGCADEAISPFDVRRVTVYPGATVKQRSNVVVPNGTMPTAGRKASFQVRRQCKLSTLNLKAPPGFSKVPTLNEERILLFQLGT